MSSRDAQANFRELLDEMDKTKEAIIVERNGKPIAALVSPEQFEQLQRLKARTWATIEAVTDRNAERDPDDVLRNVTQEVEAVRQEAYEQRQRGAAKGRR